jgi:hypothetical protein
MPSVIIQSVAFFCNAECRYAMRRSDEWQHAKCLGANLKNKDSFFPFEMKLQEKTFFYFLSKVKKNLLTCGVAPSALKVEVNRRTIESP